MTLDWCNAEIRVLKRELSDLRALVLGDGLANKVFDLTQQMVRVVEENARLKRGEFTPDELQNICHGLSVDDYSIEDRDVRVMAVAEGWAMVRRKGAAPYTIREKELKSKLPQEVAS